MIIEKYHIPFQPSTTIEMPHTAKVMSVVVQDGALWLYTAHDPDTSVPVPRKFRLIALGEDFDPDLTFISSVYCQGAVIHVFEGY